MLAVEIVVDEALDFSWSEWLGGLAISHLASGQTRLSGTVTDQPALYGILSRLRDLDLKLVSVHLTDPELPDACPTDLVDA